MATLKYREFHDAVDVLLSGIPMKYDANGEEKTMQTAGMFEIRCEKEGQNLILDKNARIKVDFASREAGTDYNLFKLDGQNAWEFIDYVEPQVNPQKINIQEEISKLEKKLKSPKNDLFVSNFNTILDVDVNGMNHFYDEAYHKKLKRKIAPYGIDHYNFRTHDYVEHQGSYYSADMMVWKNLGRKIPSWANSSNVEAEVQLIKDQQYQLKLKNSSRSFETKVKLVCHSRYIFEYTADKWNRSFNKIQAEIAEKEKQFQIRMEELRSMEEQLASTIRSYNINGFGIYNYDKLLNLDQSIPVLANFNVEGNQIPQKVYFLPQDNKTLVVYPRDKWNKVVLMPGNRGRFLAFYEGQKMAILDAKAYTAINFDSLNRVVDPAMEFRLKESISMDNQEDLRAVLDL